MDIEKIKSLIGRIDGTEDKLAGVDRLRLHVHDPETFELHLDDATEVNDLLLEASQALSALVGRLESAERALKPFSDACQDCVEPEDKSGHIWEHPAAVCISVDDLRAARAHMEKYHGR